MLLTSSLTPASQAADAGPETVTHLSPSTAVVATASSSSTTVPTPTTTYTTYTTSSTTMPLDAACGDPLATTFGRSNTFLDEPREWLITATDALFTLRAVVGAESCARCICDIDASGFVTATDALIALQAAVGRRVTLTCPVC
jgi:hypothetical protein